MPFEKRSERGFTIIEMLTVIAIMTVITAIATPTFIHWLPRYRLSAGARQIAAELQLARMKAISQNTTYRLNFISGTQYQLEKNAGFDLESGPFTLPEGITASPTGGTSVFQSRGTATTGTGNSEITVTNGAGLTKAICMETVGRVHIEESTTDC